MADRHHHKLGWTVIEHGWCQGDQHFTRYDGHKVKWDTTLQLCKGVADTRPDSKVSKPALRRKLWDNPNRTGKVRKTTSKRRVMQPLVGFGVNPVPCPC
eukprot:4267863-Amphidinium_carterae.1